MHKSWGTRGVPLPCMCGWCWGVPEALHMKDGICRVCTSCPGAGGERWGLCMGVRQFPFPPRWGMCRGGGAAVPHGTLCPQWPYCRKRCSYCNFNKYVVPTVDEVAVRACLVQEARTLLRLSQVQRWVCGGMQGECRAIRHPPASSPPSALQCHLCLLWRWHPQPGQPPHHRSGAGGCGRGCPPPRGCRGDSGGQPQFHQPRTPRWLQGGGHQPPLHRRPGERGSPWSHPSPCGPLCLPLPSCSLCSRWTTLSCGCWAGSTQRQRRGGLWRQRGGSSLAEPPSTSSSGCRGRARTPGHGGWRQHWGSAMTTSPSTS